jgi:competence protein ComEA
VEGIGPTLAERIVEYRQAHGGFASIDELADVEGIGEMRLQTLREALSP